MKELIKSNKKIVMIGGIILGALIIALVAYNLGGHKGSVPIFSKGQKVKIVASETSKIEFEEYKSDVFSMKKPKGWIVDASGSGMYYAIRVYDPNNTNNQIFYQLKMQPLLKSEAGKQFWIENSSNFYLGFKKAVVLDPPTTENFYKKFDEIAAYLKNMVGSELVNANFPTFSNFTKIEEAESNSSMKSLALDSKVIRGTFTGDNGKEGEGLFLASIVNFGNLYWFDVDYSYYMVYDIIAITADKDNFINYMDILSKSINSIEFTESYAKKTIDDGNARTKQALELNAQMQQAYDSYNGAWENRQKSYDIMSQKQSDATLGYERVYDTDTGEVYKAYNGFTDDYDGTKYQPITDDMYTESISGTIEK